jgi:putative flippase GtrA
LSAARVQVPGLRHSLVRFIVVGCVNFVVSFAAFYASYHYLPGAHGRGAVANVLAYAAGMVNSFILNRLWTFEAEGNAGVHAVKFAALNAATLAASTIVVFVLVDWAGFPALAVWLPLTIAILAAHYLGMKHWAFAEQR